MSSLGLTAYKALSRGTKSHSPEQYAARPDGPLIWGVVHDEASARADIITNPADGLEDQPFCGAEISTSTPF